MAKKAAKKKTPSKKITLKVNASFDQLMKFAATTSKKKTNDK